MKCTECICNLPSKKIFDIYPSLYELVKAGCLFFSVDFDKLKEKSKAQPICDIRQNIMFVIYENTLYSHKEISNIVGRKDHTSCVYSMKVVRNHCETEPGYKETIEDLKNFIFG